MRKCGNAIFGEAVFQGAENRFGIVQNKGNVDPEEEQEGRNAGETDLFQGLLNPNGLQVEYVGGEHVLRNMDQSRQAQNQRDELRRGHGIAPETIVVVVEWVAIIFGHRMVPYG